VPPRGYCRYYRIDAAQLPPDGRSPRASETCRNSASARIPEGTAQVLARGK
jgi:hypothetical protein